MRELNVEPGQKELVCSAIRAVLAVASCVWVIDISATHVDERLQELCASLSGWRGYSCKFYLRAGNLLLSNS